MVARVALLLDQHPAWTLTRRSGSATTTSTSVTGRLARSARTSSSTLSPTESARTRRRKLIVNGFIEPIIKQCAMEYPAEMNRLIELQMEGSIS